ncbi:MAG: lipopolysaccharide core heptose(I) kinase RfaP [Pseudomonadales bacterium]
MARLYLRDDLAAAWRGDDPFERVAGLRGELYRAVARRRTLRFEAAGRAYFAKIHFGVGWTEIFKNLLTLRRPVIGARNEYLACRHLAEQGVAAPTVAAFGERGLDPATRLSFVICDELSGCDSLEDVALGWDAAPPTAIEKRRLVMAVARFARAMHGAGVVHRDFYICHLLLDRDAWRDGDARLAVLDLHRAQLHRHIPRRWLERDLAALLYSCLDLPLGRRTWLRFVRTYRGAPLPEVMAREARFWAAVHRRALRLYRKGVRKGLVRGRFDPDAG